MKEAIILAGGLGTRLRDAVPDFPKPMAPINGRPFLEHQIDYWIAQGITHFVLSIGYRGADIKSHFQDSYRNCEVTYAEEIEPLGTGGGLLLAVQKLKSNQSFLVMNGDTFFDVAFDTLDTFHRNAGAVISVCLFEAANNNRYMGVQLNSDKTISSFKSQAGTSQLANAGIYMMDKRLFDELPWQAGDKFSLEEDFFGYCERVGEKLCGMVSQGRFIDIGVPLDYYRAGSVIEPC